MSRKDEFAEHEIYLILREAFEMRDLIVL